MHALSVRTLVLAGAVLAVTHTRAEAWDLFGGDIGGFVAFSPDECAAACNANGSCAAWTLVEPPLKHPTSPVCFLKSSFGSPELNATCTSNDVCVSGIKRSDGWCGERTNTTFGPNAVPGQGEVLSCGPNQSCVAGNIVTDTWCVIFFPIFLVYPCHGTAQTPELFCR